MNDKEPWYVFKILTVNNKQSKYLHGFAQENIHITKYCLVNQVAITETETKLKECFNNELCMHSPNNMGNCCYVPLGYNMVRMHCVT
jgi:hypothetical protein